MRRYLPRRTVLKTLGLGGLALAGATAGSAKPSTNGVPEVVKALDPTLGQLPENVAIDRRGNKYVSISPLGQIWKFSPENELPEDPSRNPFAQFPVTGVELTGPVGLEVDPRGTLYACYASDLARNPETDRDDLPTNGVWTVVDGEEPEPLAALPPDDYDLDTFPNDLALYGDSVLVTDSFRGVIYRVGSDGTAEVWADSDLLNPTGVAGFGADGIAVGKDGTVYVSNLDQGSIIEISVEKDGTAGTPTVFVQDDMLFGSDGLAFDARGNLYVAVNLQDAVRRVSPDGDIETIASNGDDFDGFDRPADVTFGTSRGEQKSVFIPNLAFPSSGAGPSFVKLDVGVPGMPIHR